VSSSVFVSVVVSHNLIIGFVLWRLHPHSRAIRIMVIIYYRWCRDLDAIVCWAC